MTGQPKSEDDGTSPRYRASAKNHPIAIAINALKRQYQAKDRERAERDANIFKWTKRGAKAAILYTFFTLFIMVAGFYSVYEARRAADSAEVSANIAQKALTGLERPYLFQNFININIANVRGWIHRAALPQLFSFDLKNYGRAPAIVKSVSCRFIATSGDPTKNQWHSGNILDDDLSQIDIAGKEIIIADPVQTFLCPDPAAMPQDKKASDLIRIDQWPLNEIAIEGREAVAQAGYIWIVGRVIYDDVFGVSHETDWCLHFDWLTDKFVAPTGTACNRRT